MSYLEKLFEKIYQRSEQLMEEKHQRGCGSSPNCKEHSYGCGSSPSCFKL